ncbi:MAG: FAD-binding oxidoreductase [Actinobacteria bacterium]|nr:FAD-binding oxidoreductase [Actinomycetota bacterium]
MTNAANEAIDEHPVVSQLREIVGPGHVLTATELVAPYATDWTRRFSGPCLAVVRPGSTAEVARVVAACAEANIAMLPQGGNTGLVGGGVPATHPGPMGLPVIVSLRRLSHISEVDQLSGQLTAGAGALLGDVQRHAAAAGWMYGVDLAARDSASIGGTVATNAGGIHVIAHGMTRAQLTGIEAVMPDGSVVSHLEGLLKDNTGYDLAALLCGSEGTLGIITAVRLRLHRPPGRTSVALIGSPSYASALELMSSATSQVLAAEVIDDTGMDLAGKVTGLTWPLAQRWPLVVLLELIDGGDGSGFESLLDDESDAVVACDAAERARLWEYRERQSEAFSSLGIVHKLDVSVPLASLAQCADELRSVVDAFSDVTVFGVFGHLADGNIHVEIAGPDADDTRVDHAILECVARYGGSISAEHGVGRAKAGELHLCRSAPEFAAMRAIKRALDPAGLMNPGVLLEG